MVLTGIFEPYMPFISFFIAICLNVLLIIIKSEWYVYLIANILMITIMLALGMEPFDFVLTFLGYILENIWDFILQLFTVRAIA